LQVADVVDVLMDRIRIASIPVRGFSTEEGWKDLCAAIQAGEVPALSGADMIDQRRRAVLGEDPDIVDPRAHQIGKRKIDDPVVARKRKCGFGATQRQDGKLTDATARQDHGDDAQRLKAIDIHRCSRVGPSS